VPTLNVAKELSRTLPSWIAGASEGLVRELIVSDGGSTDDTCTILEAVGATIKHAPAGRSSQLLAGAQAANGPWLLFLHADTALAPGWTDAVWRHIENHPDKAASFRLRYHSDDPEARWLERRVALRIKLFSLPYGDQGLLISRDLYTVLGGFTKMPLMEDVDIMRRIGARRLNMLAVDAITSAAKYERDGWRKRAWANAWLTVQFFAGVTADALAKRYR
jgi:rSAM/selenodomain-associated transferase 2